MAVIDSDAHVLETEHTWDYMLESERALKPRIVPTPNDPTSGGESWLIDGLYLGKARNVGADTSREAREIENINARLKHASTRQRPRTSRRPQPSKGPNSRCAKPSN